MADIRFDGSWTMVSFEVDIVDKRQGHVPILADELSEDGDLCRQDIIRDGDRQFIYI